MKHSHSRTNNNARLMALAGGGLCLLFAARRRSWPRFVYASLGLMLLSRGLSRRSLLREAGLGTGDANSFPPTLLPVDLKVKESLTVNCSPTEAYQFWRHLENLPRFMTHLKSIEEQANGRSHWVVKTPVGISLAWDAQIVDDRPDELIRWRTLPATTVQHTGQVQFKVAPPGRGTVVTAEIHYAPPGGVVGEAFAYLAGTLTEQLLREEIRQFKYIIETGEVATIKGQSSGRSP